MNRSLMRGVIVKYCKNVGNKYEKKGENMFGTKETSNAYACEKVERMKEMGRSMKEELSVRDKDIDTQKRGSRISEPRYDAEYRK